MNNLYKTAKERMKESLKTSFEEDRTFDEIYGDTFDEDTSDVIPKNIQKLLFHESRRKLNEENKEVNIVFVGENDFDEYDESDEDLEEGWNATTMYTLSENSITEAGFDLHAMEYPDDNFDEDENNDDIFEMIEKFEEELTSGSLPSRKTEVCVYTDNHTQEWEVVDEVGSKEPIDKEIHWIDLAMGGY